MLQSFAGPIGRESVQQMAYYGEAPPSYEESFQDQLVPTAPPSPDSPISASYSEFSEKHTVCDVGNIAMNISIASVPATALRTQMDQETTVASDSSRGKRSKKSKFFDRKLALLHQVPSVFSRSHWPFWIVASDIILNGQEDLTKYHDTSRVPFCEHSLIGIRAWVMINPLLSVGYNYLVKPPFKLGYMSDYIRIVLHGCN